MSEWVASDYPTLRFGAFLAVFVAMAVWETLAPRRSAPGARGRRWPGNLGVLAIDALLLRVVFPLGTVGVAWIAEREGWGLLNRVALPGWAAVAVSIIVLDFGMYLQHVLFHAVPALWRLHGVHHADPEFDLTTGVRFHPAEVLLSMGFKIAMVAALGAPTLGALAFEVLLNGASLFNHANARLGPRLDRAVRLLLVTPDMHRVHHSVEQHETDSNFGFSLSWWDRLLGTYRAQPDAGHDGMSIGVPGLQGRQVESLAGILALPIVEGKRRLNRRGCELGRGR